MALPVIMSHTCCIAANMRAINKSNAHNIVLLWISSLEYRNSLSIENLFHQTFRQLTATFISGMTELVLM